MTPVPPFVEGKIPLVCVDRPILPQSGATPTPPEIRAFPVATSESLLNALVDDAYKMSPMAYEVCPVPPMLAATGLTILNVNDPEGYTVPPPLSPVPVLIVIGAMITFAACVKWPRASTVNVGTFVTEPYTPGVTVELACEIVVDDPSGTIPPPVNAVPAIIPTDALDNAAFGTELHIALVALDVTRTLFAPEGAGVFMFTGVVVVCKRDAATSLVVSVIVLFTNVEARVS